MTFRSLSPRLAVMALCFGLAAAPVVASAQAFVEFPGRSLYERFGVDAVDLFDLRGQLSRSTVIDVRPRLEYDILHIEGAHHVPLGAPDFEDQVRALEEQHGGPLVFYCNGRESYMSYRAAARANAAGLGPTQAYDAGVADWADRYPGLAMLRGEPIEDPETQLITDEAFEARLLDADTFARRVRNDDNAVVLDVRGNEERDEISLFAGREMSAPLENIDTLNRFLGRANRDGDALLIFDQNGQQVRWLQYHLEERGIENYHFLEGGLQQFYDEVMAR
ncbi:MULTISPECIES: rhodanese-like domain-containing protein [unclassified Thioalkalivibrio]|uniref:rhodanese-like domain-containing protein n=1 Tax=unclassified Thioalkalivibrio TaxID=2621013 RepID=UPI00037325E3|nr:MULTISPECIES: rhodanese-like domain-containing protein [unclassified Thioalkalivibrio]